MKETEFTKKLATLPPQEAELDVLNAIRKNLGDSHVLQRMGLTVNVQVNRLQAEVGDALLSGLKAKVKSSREVKALAADLAQPAFKLREQHRADAEMEAGLVPELVREEAFKEAMRQNYVSPKGGYTKVEIVNPLNQKTYTGECHFGVDCIFIRKVANKRAFGKALSKMLLDSSLGKSGGKKALKGL